MSSHPIVDAHQKPTIRWIVQPCLGNLLLSPKCHSLHSFVSLYKANLHALTYQSSRLYRNSAKLCVCLRHPSPLPPSVALSLLDLDFSPRSTLYTTSWHSATTRHSFVLSHYALYFTDKVHSIYLSLFISQPTHFKLLLR